MTPLQPLFAIAAAACALVSPAAASALVDDAASAAEADLQRLSLEELAQVRVTSVSRRPEALAEAPASIFVIDAEDIRRSGAASLPELLRLAPNLNVQRVNAVDYAISARGFNGFEPSNKLLVLVDGRSIYSTLSSGVFWDAREIMLGDIKRIEVISGPGGTLYGANAVNGVINITTRGAQGTVGTALNLGVGSEDNTLTLRHGGLLGSAAAWRLYVQGTQRDDSFRADGSDATDAAEGLRAGGRLDWAVGVSQLTLQGDVYASRVAVNEDFCGLSTRVSGGNVLGRWTRPLAAGELQIQGYYDRFERDEGVTLETSDTWDIAVQHSVGLGRHHIVWGGGYRSVASEFVPAPGGAFLDPQKQTLTLANAFVTDRIALGSGVSLTLGAKIEDNSFTGGEFLPSVRLAWKRPGGDLVWGAISRASRTPNRIERGLTLPGFLEPGDFRSESLTAWEIGYRASPTPNVLFSISAFYNQYDDLRTVSLDPVTFLPFRFTNHGEGETWGLEAWASVDVNDRWRISAGASTLEKDFQLSGGNDITGLASTGDDPGYQVSLLSQADLSPDLELDVRLRAVDALATTDSWVDADIRLGWRPNDIVELAVSGKNLLSERRFETGDPARRRAFGRSVYVTLRTAF
ncbi:MAG: TonB-dependent receptor [Caulobacter sp.]|nr:TonB-dependent receptor [Caulobacter sp.]